MEIKTCLITAAGFGTRMGELGKSIPKPLWPIGDKTLLDLQIQYVRNLGVKKIYINIHHQAESFKKWANDKDVVLLEEEEILGSGGCVHNLKNTTNESGKLLIVNSDQFYFFDKECLQSAIKSMDSDDSVAHLFGITVSKKEKYNETIVEKGRLVAIEKNRSQEKYMTYSGVGIINLDKLEHHEGNSSFFQSVCNFRVDNVQMSLPSNCEFWDFGTLDKYFQMTYKLVNNPTSTVLNFLNTAKCKIEEDKDGNIEMKKYNMKLIKSSTQRKIQYKNIVINL